MFYKLYFKWCFEAKKIMTAFTKVVVQNTEEGIETAEAINFNTSHEHLFSSAIALD